MNKKGNNWAILLFYGAYGLFYVIALLYRRWLPSFTFHFWIAEKSQEVQFTMDLAEVCDILLLGVFFSINAFRSFIMLQDKDDPDKKIQGRFSFLLGIILLNIGVSLHMVTNQLHEFTHLMSESFIESDPNLTYLSLGLYFWDEIVSHLLIGLGFFILVFCFLFVESKNYRSTSELKGWLIKLICIGVGLGIAYGYIEGQAAVPFFFVCIILIPTTLFKRRKRPFHNATLLVCVGYIILVLVYGIITGVKPYYPYLKQIEELTP
ncbi:MAG: hypothetical protein ACTSWY_03800 [Promethearchaeota archaeon]